jgi:hypothetical protein
MLLLYYTIAFLIAIYILFLAYVKITYTFWSRQPVFHFYNLMYWVFPPGIIMHDLPEQNKYTNFTNISIKTYEQCDENDLILFQKFLQTNFYRFKSIKYDLQLENIKPYFEGHNHPCYFGFYNIDNLLTFAKHEKTIEDNKCIGVITSRPFELILDHHKINVYYVDYLCVDYEHRKQEIAPQLIQTYEYTQRHANKSISINLFKRDGKLTGIVPLTTYLTYVFDILKWKKPKNVHASYQIIPINKQNIQLVTDYIYKESHTRFKCAFMPEFGNLVSLMESKNIYIYAYLQNNVILGIYFFRNTTILFEKHNMFELFASIQLCESNIYFARGFHKALFHCFNDINFKYICIENVSHNNNIVHEIMKEHEPVLVEPSAFYLYNFAHLPIDSKDVLPIY